MQTLLFCLALVREQIAKHKVPKLWVLSSKFLSKAAFFHTKDFFLLPTKEAWFWVKDPLSSSPRLTARLLESPPLLLRPSVNGSTSWATSVGSRYRHMLPVLTPTPANSSYTIRSWATTFGMQVCGRSPKVLIHVRYDVIILLSNH